MVDLPAPFSPTSACVSPAARENDTPATAATAPNAFETPRTSSSGARSVSCRVIATSGGLKGFICRTPVNVL